MEVEARWQMTSPPATQSTASQSPRVVPIAPRAILLSALAAAVYLFVAGNFRFDYRQTQFAHHILIADAMLHGQLHVRDEIVRRMLEDGYRVGREYIQRDLDRTGQQLTPDAWRSALDQYIKYRVLYDWSAVGDKLYGYWAPLASVVMVPFVAAFGPRVSDTLVDALLGAMNVGLFYWLLRRVDRLGLLPLRESCCIGLTLLLAFGTVNFYLSSTGRVWFAVQIVTLTAMLAACIAILSPARSRATYVWAGVFFGAAILARNVAVLLGLFFVGVIWLRSREVPDHRRRQTFVSRLAWFCLPCVVAIGLQGLYNQARFGSITEDGVGIQLRTSADPRFIADYTQFGLFSPHYLPRNAKYYLWNFELPRDEAGKLTIDVNGNSMFLVTPPLLYLFLAWRARAPLVLAAAAGVVPLFTALLLFMGTGYLQFGNRYLLEALPLLLLLVGAGMAGRISHVGYVLIVLAMAANAFGTYCWACWADCSRIQPHVGRWTLPIFVAAALAARLAYLGWWAGSRPGLKIPARGRSAA
jgi:hypothetical protein